MLIKIQIVNFFSFRLKKKDVYFLVWEKQGHYLETIITLSFPLSFLSMDVIFKELDYS